MLVKIWLASKETHRKSGTQTTLFVSAFTVTEGLPAVFSNCTSGGLCKADRCGSSRLTMELKNNTSCGWLDGPRSTPEKYS